MISLAVTPPFFLALTVLTFVVFTREFGRLSELLITRNAAIDVIIMIALTILPTILVFSLPLSFLIGILIGLSGLSGESQITALRACGVPLRALMRPIIMLGIVIGSLTALMSLWMLPETNNRFFALTDKISLRQATAQVQPRVFNEGYPSIVFYLDDLATDKQRWSRVFLSDNTDPRAPRTVLAREGSWVTDPVASRLQLHLENGTIYELDPDNPGKDKLSIFRSTDIPVEIVREAAHDDSPKENHKRRTTELSTGELWSNHETDSEEILKRNIELHKRFAIPFSILGFSLLGLTLGVNSSKGGRTSGFVWSLLLVMTWFVLFTDGLRLASVQKVPPWLGAWGADILLTLVGSVLLLTAERGSRLSNWMSNSSSIIRLNQIRTRWHIDSAQDRIRRFDDAIISSTSRITRMFFPRILDIYVSRGFLVYFLWSTAACSALFVILTLFDLLDDIIKNRINLMYVINYFVFLMPQILALVVPMAILLAILINFGIMEKSSEVTALKAGGWSLYRISLPVFFTSALFCVGLYLNQDYILPYANIRQDSLRNVIKGRPAQTSNSPQHKWMFGESNRVFNYDYFDSSRNLFIGLNIYEIDFGSLKMLRRIVSSRATVDDSGIWTLENGWIRDFQSEQRGFRRFDKSELNLPEKPSYFQKEIFQPKESAKMPYLELKKYINYLKKAGYNATELQVELYKKAAFPFSCLVMCMVGVPFSFSMGKKGAFYGIALSIGIAILYWGISGVFEKMGSYGLLVPFLAAWAPNILFGAAGLALLFTIRT